jgi:hypothetical protein
MVLSFGFTLLSFGVGARGPSEGDVTPLLAVSPAAVFVLLGEEGGACLLQAVQDMIADPSATVRIVR